MAFTSPSTRAAAGGPLPGKPGLLDWTKGGLYSIDRRGIVRIARYNLQRFDRVGRVGGEPAALVAADSGRLYVALHDGTIKRSADGGISWQIEPPREARGGKRTERRAERRTVAPRAPRSKQRPDAPTRERREALRDLPGPASDSLARK
jgi:hypothetical protein